MWRTIKRSVLLFLFILSVSCVSLFSSSLGIAGSYHKSSLIENGYDFDLFGDIEGLKIGVGTDSFEDISISLEYDLVLKNTFAFEVYTYNEHSFIDKGGFMVTGLGVGQDFVICGPFYMRYRLGLEFSFSYSDYSPLFKPIAFSPLILLSLSLDFGYIETEIYFTGSTFFYRSFQALPVIGFYFRWNIDDENAIAADVNLSPADYLGRFDVSSINARVMYIYTF